MTFVLITFVSATVALMPFILMTFVIATFAQMTFVINEICYDETCNHYIV